MDLLFGLLSAGRLPRRVLDGRRIQHNSDNHYLEMRPQPR